MRRPSRLVTAVLTAAALLFSQLAVSGYACPGMDEPVTHAVVDAAAPACDEVDNANLCQQHCEYGKAVLEQAKPVKVPLAMATDRVRSPAAVPVPHARARTFTRFASVAGPPPRSRSTVLRI